jgi:hypothetical protein
MKRAFLLLLAATMFVACGEQKGNAAAEMNNYKAEWSEITSLLDAEAVEAEGFDAWYNTLTNSEVRNLYAAAEKFGESCKDAEHWYKNLSDADQDVALDAAKTWEQENPALQLQVELFAANMLGVNLDSDETMPLLKVYAPEPVAETEPVVETEPEVVTEPLAPEVVAE